ncbi:MAG: hypothetical protein JJU46_10615 [Balneolaceae bacterium]|nr:hypothetical protein [Balneolaceae bacterium]MCH8548874.1 hypothetical protein [Balneolaceae bacterium]
MDSDKQGKTGDQNLKVGKMDGNLANQSVSGNRNRVKVINNTLNFPLNEQGKEALKYMMGINSEISKDNFDIQKDREEIARLRGELSELFETLKESSRNKESEHLNAGGIQVSKVELLLKKAILLKSEAEQMLNEQIFQSDQRMHAKSSEGSANYKTSLPDPDLENYRAKLREALELLEEANRMEHGNLEVILHMAQVIGKLHPDRPDDERKLLRQVLGLLRHPRNDTEWFQKAEATYLMARAGDETHPVLLAEAREIFERIKRFDWVRKCDDILESLEAATEANHLHSHPDQTHQEHGNQNRHSSEKESHSTVDFHPVGQWQVEVSDGSYITIQFYPNGTVQGTQQNPMMFQYSWFTGQWFYIPEQNMLQLQGWYNTGMNFYEHIVMSKTPDGQYTGVGTMGYTYQFRR